MATVTVVRAMRRKVLGDKKSPLVNTLKRKSGTSLTYDIKRLANEIEGFGALSAEDVEHVIKSLVRNMRAILCDGNRLKLDGFGTFYTTFHCKATADPKDCTVRNIDRVHVRFRVDNILRLTNDSNATTKGMSNNIAFELETPKTNGGKSGGNTGGNTGGGKDDNPLG
jgi:predicted histone-like DNA-binding protein